jgi:hypothetical protein
VDESGTTRVTVEEAARLLDIEKGSVKKRVQRGKLRSERDASGTLYVYVDRSETVRDTSQGRSETGPLFEVMRDEIAHLRRESERKDAIIMSLSQSNAELSRTIRALEAPQETPPEARESTETVEQEQEIATERERRKMAESTMREGMDEERWRREEAERERDELRQELFALRREREFTETVEEQQGRGTPRPDAPGPQEGVRRPWWRKLIRR